MSDTLREAVEELRDRLETNPRAWLGPPAVVHALNRILDAHPDSRMFSEDGEMSYRRPDGGEQIVRIIRGDGLQWVWKKHLDAALDVHPDRERTLREAAEAVCRADAQREKGQRISLRPSLDALRSALESTGGEEARSDG